MFLQQTCGSVGRVLPAVLAPLIIVELSADPSWVGFYFGLTAVAALVGQLGSGGFLIRHGAIRMSQIALLSVGGGMAVAVTEVRRACALGACRKRRVVRARLRAPTRTAWFVIVPPCLPDEAGHAPLHLGNQ
jgi:hypothetical protein